MYLHFVQKILHFREDLTNPAVSFRNRYQIAIPLT